VGVVRVRVVVVVALHGQAQFLIDSITSALGQSLPETGIVIVNDGCPDPASHQLGTAYSAAYPDRIAYVRQPNRGPSSARNHGVRHALRRWPELEACFFLDADNMLQPHALETMYAHLRSNESIGWVYAVLERFGGDNRAWNPDTPANLFRMLFENQSDTASLVHRKVFDDGIFFDETEPGYEDWEFFVRVLRKGYRGESAGYCGVLYRVRDGSRQVNAEAEHRAHAHGIMVRHRDALEPRRLTGIEHRHCPRFLWVDAGDRSFRSFTDAAAANTLTPASIRPPHPWPPVLMIGSEEARQLLAAAKLRCGVHLLVQALLPRFPVTITFENRGPNWQITKSADPDLAAHILCLYSWEFKHDADAASAMSSIGPKAGRFLAGAQRLVVQLPAMAQVAVPKPLAPGTVSAALAAALEAGMFEPAPQAKPQEGRQWPTRHFAWERHCVQLNTTYPRSDDDNLHIAFVAPWLKLGGTDQCIIQLSRAILRLAPKAKLHLVSTREGVECGFDKTEAFDEVVFLGGLDDWDRKTRLCDTVLRSMDLVINAHSEVAYHSLKWRLRRLKHERQGVHVSYLHVMDEARGRLVGYPVEAVAIEHGFDGFAVISQSLRSFLINNGVNPGKIRIARNAPVVRPASVELAMEMAAAKARRLAAGERPLRLLFAGRADYQKGMSRLKGMVDILAARMAPFELTFVGGANLAAEAVELPPSHVRLHPPTHDEVALARYYAEADVCVLLSRWEGVPLSLLDAMAHGCIVLATDVGAVSELVESGSTGFLVSNDRDDRVAPQAADLVVQMLADKTGGLDLRRQAVATAWRYSWDAAAREFLGFLPESVRARHGLSSIQVAP
jgi:glycosyltransferase involved in cell wall biosynthesis